MLLPRRLQQLSVLNNDIINQHNIDEFVWLYKLYGERRVMMIHEGLIKEVYVRDGRYKFVTIGTCHISKSFIFDTELCNGVYHVFDVIKVNSKMNFKERMEVARKLSLPDFIKIKPYFEINSWDELIKITNTIDHDPDGNDIDGIVVQLIHQPYDSNRPISFLLKRRVMNTIDFYIHDSKLYLTNRYNNNVVKNINENVKNITVDNTFLTMLSTPLYNNLGTYNQGEISRLIKTNKQLLDDYPIKYQKEIMESIEKTINDKVYEFGFIEGGRLVPIRERVGKKLPNRYDVALSNVELCFNPLTTSENIYFQKQNGDRTLINAYHEVSHIFRNTILDETMKELSGTKNLNVFDLCGGRGGDIYKMSSTIDIKNLVVEDSDKTALVTYLRKLIKGKKKFNVRIIDIPLSSNNDGIIDELKGINLDYNLILMNYAIHYLCTDIKNIEALVDLVTSCLDPDGIFVVTYFDGEQILKLLGQNKEIKLGDLKIEIIKRDGETIIANMPLPTISSTGFRSEPLTTNYYLSYLNANLKLIKSEYVYKMANIESNNEFDKVIDVLKLVKMNIYRGK